MSLVPVTISIERDTEADDAYGGVTLTPVTVYADLAAWMNYTSRTPNLRSESGQKGAVGPGVVTRMLGLCKFEPVPPGVTIQTNDRVVTSDGARWLVITPPRVYEYTLQLDLERIQ